MAQPLLANCIQFWLSKLKDPAEGEDVERQLARYQMPRRFGLKRETEATAVDKGTIATAMDKRE